MGKGSDRFSQPFHFSRPNLVVLLNPFDKFAWLKAIETELNGNSRIHVNPFSERVLGIEGPVCEYFSIDTGEG